MSGDGGQSVTDLLEACIGLTVIIEVSIFGVPIGNVARLGSGLAPAAKMMQVFQQSYP